MVVQFKFVHHLAAIGIEGTQDWLVLAILFMGEALANRYYFLASPFVNYPSNLRKKHTSELLHTAIKCTKILRRIPPQSRRSRSDSEPAIPTRPAFRTRSETGALQAKRTSCSSTKDFASKFGDNSVTITASRQTAH